jgi:hypothetical protein
MSTANVSQVILPMKGDIVLTHKGYRRLWDGRHWRVLCRISNCTAQRQGSLYNKFGLCKKHFTQMKFKKLKSLSSNIEQQNQIKIVSEEEKKKISKCRHLNVIIDQLRHSQARSEPGSVE